MPFTGELTMRDFDDAITRTVLTMWDSVLQTPIERADGVAAPETGASVLVGCVYLAGPIGGVVTLACPLSLAQQSAGRMFHLSTPDVTLADAHDALGELVNIVGGSLKALLPEGHTLSLPTIVEGSDHPSRFMGTDPANRVCFESGSQGLVVSFFRVGAQATPSAS
jgi:CheY-specific phosphatase CheX